VSGRAHPRSRYLTLVTDQPGAEPVSSPRAGAVKLTRSAEIDFDQAEAFLLSLERETSTGDLRAAYLLGLAEGHLANLLELIRGLTG
jgi:hypothetical protein